MAAPSQGVSMLKKPRTIVSLGHGSATTEKDTKPSPDSLNSVLGTGSKGVDGRVSEETELKQALPAGMPRARLSPPLSGSEGKRQSKLIRKQNKLKGL